MKQYRLLLLIISLVPAGYFLVQQWQEHRLVVGYLDGHGLNGAPLNRATALRVADTVRRDFDVDEERFERLNVGRQPFLRTTTADLLTAREGLCGEGTRVIVNLLLEMGFDATRVVLFNEHLESSHTLVSVVVDDREFLLDSINSIPEITQILAEHDIKARDFNVLHYVDDLEGRRALADAEHVSHSEAVQPFFYHFWLYSYEAIPYSKLLTTVGIDVRVFSFQRPFRWISGLAEKPNVVYALACLALAPILYSMLLLTLKGLKLGIHVRRGGPGTGRSPNAAHPADRLET